jgi:hypothetical protein
MLVDSFETVRARAFVPVAMLLLVVLLFAGACSDETRKPDERSSPATEKTGVTEEPTSAPTTRLETTEDSPPEISLGDDPGGKPDAVIRLEGDTGTMFSGLCSVGEKRSVLSGQVPKRFEFDLKGRQLSCRIEKRDGDTGDLEVILVAGDSTRSVQQTNAPGGVIEVSYEGE